MAALTDGPETASPDLVDATHIVAGQRPNTITDFAEGDMIALKKSGFPGIGPAGVLQAKYFHAGEAETPKQKVLYDADGGGCSSQTRLRHACAPAHRQDRQEPRPFRSHRH